MARYDVTAWCTVPHYTTFEVDAGTIDEALEKAKLQARDECGEPCNGEFDWDQFEIDSEGNESACLSYLAPPRLIENAAPTLLAALCRFEAAWRIWADAIRRVPELAAPTEMFDIYEQARAAIDEATQHQGRAP